MQLTAADVGTLALMPLEEIDRLRAGYAARSMEGPVFESHLERLRESHSGWATDDAIAALIRGRVPVVREVKRSRATKGRALSLEETRQIRTLREAGVPVAEPTAEPELEGVELLADVVDRTLARVQADLDDVSPVPLRLPVAGGEVLPSLEDVQAAGHLALDLGAPAAIAEAELVGDVATASEIKALSEAHRQQHGRGGLR